METLPRKKYKLELVLEAHSFDELLKDLDNFAYTLERGYQPDLAKRDMIGIGIATLTRDDSAPTKEEYDKLLIAWRENYKKSKNNIE